MAKFYGTIQGQRGMATRLGHRSIEAVAASWHGAVQTTLYEREGEIWARIETRTWEGRGRNNLLYDGPLSAAQEASPAKPLWALA